MVGEIAINDLNTLVFGTCSMLLMLMAIIVFAFLFQRKLLKKQQAYSEIEKLLQKEELRSAYAIMEGKEIERKRIAGDLHDNIGSILATLRMYSDLILEQVHDPQAKRLSKKISELTEQAATETRRISHDLDSGIIRYFGLQKAIHELCDAIRQAHKLNIHLSIDQELDLDGERSLNIYRIVQELFNNTLKHAHASKVQLSVSQVDHEYISIIFEDNGQGFDTGKTGNGIGLHNIRTRVERFRGMINIHSLIAKGTTVITEIPLK